MNLNTKNANDLISKNNAVSKSAAANIINESDVETFDVLNKNSEQIFDYIKEKIIKNLSLAVNKDNVFNLFNFTKVYSEDFKSVILNPLINFSNDEIVKRFFDILKNGQDEQKTYALEFFAEIKNTESVAFAEKYLKSEFEPLKFASIRLLSKYCEKEEYNRSIEILKNGEDEIEKLEAVEFLSCYGDKEAFDVVFEYFIKSGLSDIAALNLLYLKSFDELISEDREDEILKLLFSLLRGYPENVNFYELDYFLNENLLNYLIKSDKSFAYLICFYMKNKLEDALNDEAYAIDLSGAEKTEAEFLSDRLSAVLSGINVTETVENSLLSKDKYENLLALEFVGSLDNEPSVDKIIKLCENSNDDEITANSLNCLNRLRALDLDFIKKISEKISNPLLRAEIEKRYLNP